MKNAREPLLISLDPLDLWQGGQRIASVGPWELRRGQRWWVRGPNGSGKSTFLALLAGKLWPGPGQHQHRRYHEPDADSPVSTWSPLAARGRIALLNPERQNRYLHQDWNLTAAEVVATGFLDTDLLHERPQPQECSRLQTLMQALDLNPLWDRPFLELSQGERRRVLIARALAQDPEVLLLDEFAEGLDRASRETLWVTLDTLAAQGKAIVITSHRPLPRQGPGWSTLEIRPAGLTDASSHPPEAPLSSKASPLLLNDPLIRVRGDFYLEGQPLLSRLDWTLTSGQHTAISGPNGCGKTAFLRLLWGELHLAHGGERIYGDDPTLTVRDLRRRAGFFHPDMHAWFRPDQEVANVILSGFFATIDLFDPVTESQRERLHQVARTLGLKPFLERSFGTLSYGQARRVLLARALVARPPLAFLDEPFDGLDPEARGRLLQHWEDLVRRGDTTFVLTCHHQEDHPAWIRHRLRITPERRLKSCVIAAAS